MPLPKNHIQFQHQKGKNQEDEKKCMYIYRERDSHLKIHPKPEKGQSISAQTCQKHHKSIKPKCYVQGIRKKEKNKK